jgi:hypothetical protein
LDRVESEMLYKFSLNPTPKYVKSLVDPNYIFTVKNNLDEITTDLKSKK